MVASDLADQGLLYYLHIPKTAGTTFTAILDRQFSAEHICPAQLWHELLRIPPERLRQYRLLRGHFYYCVRALLPPGTRMVTLLRDPVERSLSHYSHILREPGHYLHDRALALGSLENFLHDHETRTMIENFQVRSIGLDLDPVAMASALDADSLNHLMLERLVETAMPAGIADDELLKRAKDRLETFAFVGLAERMQEALAVLAHTFDWVMPTAYPNLNVSSNRLRREAIPMQTLDLIREYTQLDSELYEHARCLFEARHYLIET